MTESLVRAWNGGQAAPRPPASGLSSLLLRAASVLGLSLIVACSGSGGSGGCGGSGGGLAKLKGGFPVDKRVEGAVQLRIAKPLFDFLEQNGKSFIDAALPGGTIPIPSTCSGDAQICCGTSCSMKLDFQSLKIDPQPPQTNKITVRAKLKTLTDMPVKYKSGIINVNCKISLDTARKGKPDLGITLAFSAAPNAATKLTDIDFIDGATDLLDLDNDDIDIDGDFFCDTVDLLLKGTVVNALKDQIKKQLAGPLDELFCQKCETKDDCSSLANQGCSAAKKQCTRDGKCMQFLGLEGRIDLSGLGAFAPAAKAAAIDLYAAAGGYAGVEAAPTGGLSLGMLGGGLAPTKSTCAPARPAPTRPMPLGKTAAFSTNAAPNTKPYHVGAGISTLELDLLGHAFYESGGLCLEIGTQQVELLSSSLLSALIPSLNDLTRGINSSIKLVARPTQAPTFTLGKGTFKTDAMGKKTIDDPLLHLVVKDLAFDFYVYMDERYVRFMRQTVDLDVPLALDVDNMNQIVPMLGDLDNGVGNVRVTDSALLKETPMQLARLFPSLLPVLVGSIGSSLSPIKLPDLMGMQLVPVQITSTPDGAGKLSYLGLFLALKTAGMPLVADAISATVTQAGAPVETYASLASLEVPGAGEMDVRAEQQATPRVTLYLDADSRNPGVTEWQVRLDGGLWRPFDAQRQLTLQEAALRLPGGHVVEVRARTQGQPGTLDPTPARVEFFLSPKAEPAPRRALIEGDGTATPSQALKNPKAEEGGCTVAPHGTLRLPAVLLMLAALGLLGRRRVRRAATVVIAAALMLVAPACKNDNTFINEDQDMSGEADLSEVAAKPKAEFSPFDEIGRYQSAVVRNGTLYISAYNATFGDLAFTEVKSATDKLVWHPVDGLPPGDPQSTDGRSYRGGYVDAGDDIGRFTSLGFTAQGAPLIAYQDVTNGAVKLARRDGDKWSSSVIADAKEGSGVGLFAQLLVEADDTPVVAYMIPGVTKMDGKVVSQLVVARAESKTPAGPADWTKKVVEEQAVSCAGLCAADSACVYVDPVKKERLNTVCKKVEKNCTPSCKMATACMAMKCVDALGPPPADLPEGTGLFARLLSDKSGSQLLFYNRSSGALKVASGTDWKVTVLQGGDGKSDVGRYIGAAIGSDGTVHVAFSSNEGKLHYASYKGAIMMMPKAELVDDGARMGDSHSVGAGAVLFLDADKPVIAYQNATLATLELARRDMMGWTKKTLAGTGTVSRGYYPQAVSLGGKWWVLDVVYDRKADALTQIQFSGL